MKEQQLKIFKKSFFYVNFSTFWSKLGWWFNSKKVKVPEKTKTINSIEKTLEKEESKMYRSFRQHKTSLRKTCCVLSWVCVRAVMPYVQKLQSNFEAAAWGLCDTRIFWIKKQKTARLMWIFSLSIKFGRNLNQTENKSKRTLLICRARRFQ